MVLVLVLAAILLCLAIPVLDRTQQNWLLKADADQLAATLRGARQEAIYSSKPKSVLFYPDSNCYRVSGESMQYLNKDIRYIGRTTFTKKIGTVPACTFSASGAPSSGGTITLSNKYNRKIYIILNPAAARIRVDDSPPASWEKGV
ncbi:MAG TPA: GspH/FimT family protein [Syntrophomonadaceae bacterium]|nr:GspH/FimT family protein [Syntrophomonadaceae bacterium]HRX21257.1 GspH/FimT family protein [Syntrophomonadaceae bacterium]